jgi:uncharacterized protein (TIGR02246 family)
MKLIHRVSNTLFIMAVAIAALAQTAGSQARDERAIRALSEQWQHDIAAQNVERVVALHAADAVVMLSHAPLVKGSTAIRSMYSEMVATPGLKLQWTPTTIEVTSPTRATEYGTYTESFDAPGGKGTDAGNYVVIWHKINGRWRIALDAPNTTSPMPAPCVTK